MRKLMIVLAVVLVIGSVGYLVAGYLIYNQLSPVAAQCGGVFAAYAQNFTPADFTPDYRDNTPDATPYLMIDYQEIEFPARDTADDITIRAFFAPAASEEAVIVVHGVNSCRRNPEVLLPAGMLHRNNYNVLLLDMRNQGDSEIINGRTTVGNNEWRDVVGAYDWLIAQGFASEDIGLVGVSLGGAASANAFGQEQGISALWLDSTFADINNVLTAELQRNGYPLFLKNAALVTARINSVNLTEYSPLQSVSQHNNRPVFITHGTADTRLSVDYATDLYNAAGENAELWIVEGTEHVEAMFRYPDEYNERLNAFFDSALRQDSISPSS
jgi:fermentation-respiration switch protein FrsA (DUF1100 family)